MHKPGCASGSRVWPSTSHACHDHSPGACVRCSARYEGGLPRKEDGSIDYSKDFFTTPAYLTVSGQLNGEYYACGLSNVYTFGRCLRACSCCHIQLASSAQHQSHPKLLPIP